MTRNAWTKIPLIAVCGFATLSLLECKAAKVEGGLVGAGGHGGSSASQGDASLGSGTGGSDAFVITVNLDVIPSWWGTADAPQAPDTPAPPSIDSNCGVITVETTRQPVDVLLVLDRSSSMDYSIDADCYCATSDAGVFGSICTNTSNCTTRWNAVKPAVTTTLSSSKYVNWGLKFFASPNTTAQCSVNNTMEVPIGAGTAAAVQAQVDSATLSLSTPTTAALKAATAYLKTVTDSNKKFILLATDGEPNCGVTGTSTQPSLQVVDVTGASNAAASAFAAGFPVYVVGIGPNLSTLTQIANSGGTTDFFPVSSPQGLADALSSISKIVGSCTFNASKAPPDTSNVAVYVNKQLIDQSTTQGWTFGATTQEIVLKGTYCDDITAGNDTKVQILFGCPGAPPFDPILP